MPSHAKLILVGLLALGLSPVVHAEPIAVVNGRAIARGDFGLALVDALGTNALETFVDWALLEQEAERLGIATSEEEPAARHELEVELRMRAVIDKERVGPEEFRRAARRRGWDLDELRRQLEDSISPNSLRARLLAEKILTPDLDLGEAVLRAHYERTRGERRLAAHVVLPTKPQAEQLLRMLQANPSFWAEAVLRYSLDRASVPCNGRLRPVPVGSRIGRALADVPDGGLALFEEADQWHVLRPLGTVKATEEPFESVVDHLRAEVTVLECDSRYERLLADLNARASVIPNLPAGPAEAGPLGADAAVFVNGRPLALERFADVLVQEYGRTMIEPYLERTLILQEAARRGLTVSEADCAARRARIADQLFADQAAQRNLSVEELSANLVRSGLEPEGLKAELVRQLACPDDIRATLLAERMVADGLEVSEADVQAAYQDLSGARVIVREVSADNPVAAEQMYRKLQQGLDMDLVARTEMTEPGLWMEGAPETAVTPDHPYWRYAQDLAPGQTSGIFKEDGRYRIIRALERSSPSDAPSLESVRESLAQEARMRKSRVRIRALLMKLKAEADIELKLD